jgi:glutaredoxin
MVKLSGQTAVPVIDVDGKIIVGFDKERLKKNLRLK